MLKFFLVPVLVFASGCAQIGQKEIRKTTVASENGNGPLTPSGPAQSSEFQPACPASNAKLIYVEVFDGPREEMAQLKGEDTVDEGIYDLRYVYDLGRFVSMRCLYSDGKAVDITFKRRISECRYKIKKGIVASFECR